MSGGRTTPLLPAPEPLVGRQRELRRLGRLLDDDGPRAVAVCGPAGAGKSRVLAEVARAAAGAEWSVEQVFASRSVRSIPLGAVSHLLVEVTRRLPSTTASPPSAAGGGDRGR